MNYSTIQADTSILAQYKSREYIELKCCKCQKLYNKTKHFVQGKISKGYTKNYCSPECANSKDETNYTTFNCANCDISNTRLFSRLVGENNFCDNSCAATFNNTRRTATISKNKEYIHKIPKQPICENICLHCKILFIKKKGTFCSVDCTQKHKQEKTIKNIKSGSASSKTIKTYLIKLNGCRCSVCNLSEWNNTIIPIELEHIDGNSDNNTLDNCCLICPNCHALTPTYKVKNKGNGRHYRKMRYQSGKSY